MAKASAKHQSWDMTVNLLLDAAVLEWPAWTYQSREVLSHGVEGLSRSKNRRGTGRSFPRVCLGAEPVNNILRRAKCLVLFHEGINEVIRGCPYVIPNRGPRHEPLVVALNVGKIFRGHDVNPLRLVGSLPGASYTRLDRGDT